MSASTDPDDAAIDRIMEMSAEELAASEGITVEELLERGRQTKGRVLSTRKACQLESLRWREDQLVENPEGKKVWLKASFSGTSRIGLTDCCEEITPCEWHKAIASHNL